MAYNHNMTPDKLRKWRKANGYSQSQLAKVLQVHVMTISKWERGERAIPPFLELALKSVPVKGGRE